MAHRPVGAGISLTTSATSGLTTSFSVQSDVLRVVAVSSGVFVSVGANPTATTSDYYIPAGSSATLALTKASNRVVGVTTGTTTTIDFAQGTQSPFGIGDHVSLSGALESLYNFNHARVLSVDTSSSYDGYFQSRIIVDYNSSGILTAFSSKDATLRNSLRLAARTEGSAGTLYAQQVQISGQA
jgi:hypothetical protein